MAQRARVARRKKWTTQPQWDELQGVAEPSDRPPCIVAIDPAASTGWCVIELVDGEREVWHGQCEMRLLGDELGPVVEGRDCVVAVERGYIAWPAQGADADEYRKSERAMITFFERTGKVLGWTDTNLQLQAPVWRPTARQWRSQIRDFKGVRGRPALKERAVQVAERLTGDAFRKQAHWVENRSQRFGTGVLLDDEADAVCIAFAALKFFTQNHWPTWAEIEEGVGYE